MKSLVFVDDQPEVLGGIRASLRRRRSEWDMRFYTSGVEALDALEAQPCDVVVSDLKMPGMDGGELLRLVQDRHPDTVRLVLSGFADKELSLRAATAAHQYLSKPCDARELEATIESCLSVQQLLGDDKVRQAVLGLRGLPASPQAYLRIRELLRRSDTDLHAVARAVEETVSVTARLLQIVNSSFFALARRVSSAYEAIVYLGADVVSSVVLCSELFEACHSSNSAECLLAQLEKHSLATARLSALTADDKAGRENLFLAGLLHDVGKLALAASDLQRYSALHREAIETGTSLAELERREYGVDHAQIGGRLLAVWGLPYRLVDTVAHHHAPHGREGADVAVRLADYLAHEAIGDGLAPTERDWLANCPFADRLPQLRSAAEEAVLVHG